MKPQFKPGDTVVDCDGGHWHITGEDAGWWIMRRDGEEQEWLALINGFEENHHLLVVQSDPDVQRMVDEYYAG